MTSRESIHKPKRRVGELGEGEGGGQEKGRENRLTPLECCVGASVLGILLSVSLFSSNHQHFDQQLIDLGPA